MLRRKLDDHGVSVDMAGWSLFTGVIPVARVNGAGIGALGLALAAAGVPSEEDQGLGKRSYLWGAKLDYRTENGRPLSIRLLRAGADIILSMACTSTSYWPGFLYAPSSNETRDAMLF